MAEDFKPAAPPGGVQRTTCVVLHCVITGWDQIYSAFSNDDTDDIFKYCISVYVIKQSL